MHSRYEIGLEQYVLTISVEANLTLEIGNTTILPAAMRYQTELAGNVAALKAAGVEADTSLARGVSPPVADLRQRLLTLADVIAHEHPEDGMEAATYCRDTVLPAMARSARPPTPRGTRCRRPVVPADLPGDALHPLNGRPSATDPGVRGRRA